MNCRLFLFVIVASLLPTANATLMRLDFSGTIAGELEVDEGPSLGVFSGYYILDISVPDSDDSLQYGRYFGAVVEGSVDWDGFQIDLATGIVVTGVNNNSGVLNDVFFILSNNLDGNLFQFSLGDETQSVFSDDSLPAELNLLDFDQFELDNVNSTGAFVNIDSQAYQGSVEFINYRAVPVPGALILFSSGLMGMVAYLRRRNLTDHPNY